MEIHPKTDRETDENRECDQSLLSISATLHVLPFFLMILSTFVLMVIFASEADSRLQLQIRDEAKSSEELAKLHTELAAVYDNQDQVIVGFFVVMAVCSFGLLTAPLWAWKHLNALQHYPKSFPSLKAKILAMLVPLFVLCSTATYLIRSPRPHGFWHAFSYPLVVAATIVVVILFSHFFLVWFEKRPQQRLGDSPLWRKIAGLALLAIAAGIPSALLFDHDNSDRIQNRQWWAASSAEAPGLAVARSKRISAIAEMRRIDRELHAEPDLKKKESLHAAHTAFYHQRKNADAEIAALTEKQQRNVSKIAYGQMGRPSRSKHGAVVAGLAAFSGWILFLRGRSDRELSSAAG